MAKQRRPKKTDIPLRQPDRAEPDGKDTLLHLAQQRNLFEQASQRQDELSSSSASPERILEALLSTTTIAMVHFTFDVLVQHQYGQKISWHTVWWDTARAWLVFLFLFYVLHPHRPNAVLIPGLPLRLQRPLRQAVFFAMSVSAGCYLIYVTNSRGYLATMKQAPPLGCLWLWAVVELDLVWACLSLLGAALFLQLGGYQLR